MFESQNKLRHLPFFEFIAARSEDDAQWRSATAGLVVLRLVDAWAEDGRDAVADDAWAIHNVRACIDSVDPGTPIRSLLGRVVDALEQQGSVVRNVATPLIAYGQALEFDAHWDLASDVYHTVLCHLDPVTDPDSSVGAHLSLARCYVNLNQLADATVALDAASDIAAASDDMVGVLRARIAQAKISNIRGNYPQAEQILDDTIRRASGSMMRDVRSRALHERSNIAHNRGNYELAIRMAYEALGQSQSSRERDRILSDLALSFLHLGVFSAAQDAYMVLSVTAQEQYIRWAAMLNLMEIAAQTGAQTLFELYRRQLVDQPLPPRMAAAFQLNAGNGYRRFHDFSRAREYLERALAMSEAEGFNKYVFEAEEALRELETPTPPPKAATTLSLDTQEVASAIQQLREEAVVG